MKQIIYISVMLVFCYIVFKRKIYPLFSKRKEKADTQKQEQVTQSGTESALTVLSDNTGGYTTGGIRTQYMVLVFDYTEAVTPLEFGDRIESKLTNVLLQVAELGCPYRVEYLTLTTALIVMISYVITNPPLQLQKLQKQ